MEPAVLPLQADFARAFAQEWIDAWNSHDLEHVLAHYAEDAVLSSPVALQRFGGDGTLRGKTALRDYFARGLAAYPDLRFDLIETLWGTETIVVGYANNHRGSKTAEVMLLNPAGKVSRVWANYDQ
ncbi:MAG TPA: nuclear transport factor 2 family protein [Terracidiphilus sp.]|nr:nuclear transport factor 2 family protein [Terracidiphilus sp.]